MINYFQGDLLDSQAYAVVNTVNTFGVMGKGIALRFKKEFPHNYNIYRTTCHHRQLTIGTLLIVQDKSLLLGERLIINFPTKTHWRLPSEYVYIERGLTALKKAILERQIPSLAIPALGCGNGGLDWSVVKPMITTALSGIPADIDIFEPTF